MYRCPTCGKSNIDHGQVKIADFGRVWWDRDVYNQSDNEELNDLNKPISAIHCLNCGHIELYLPGKKNKRRN